MLLFDDEPVCSALLGAPLRRGLRCAFLMVRRDSVGKAGSIPACRLAASMVLVAVLREVSDAVER